MKLGFVGLGRMGSRMAIKLLSEGYELVVWNRNLERKAQFSQDIINLNLQNKAHIAQSVKELVDALPKQKIIWSMLPAGAPTEEILITQVAGIVDKGDIVIDGGNAYFEDTQKRYQHFTKNGVLFLGVGVSGGIIAAVEGYPMMVGGSKEAYEVIRPILDSLAKPHGGHEYFGEGGAGHFVKMVHNGIEYGIMQAIGEGFGVMDKTPYNLDLVKVANLYQKGTLVSGFMMQRTIEALNKDPKLSKIDGYIEDSGEGKWMIDYAKKEGLPIEVIDRSLDFRVKSRQDTAISSSFAARMVAALRNVFGGHEVKTKE